MIAACSIDATQSEDADNESDLGTVRSAWSAVRLVSNADMNGDGRADRVSRTAINEFLVALATGPTTFGPNQLWMQHGGPYQDDVQGQLVDLNGDGKMDLIYRGVDNSFWASVTNTTGTGFLPVKRWIQHGGGYHPDQAKYADVNGDRKMDLVFRGLDNSFWVSISAGTGFLPPAKWLQHGGGFSAGQTIYSDLNGDKKADLTFKGGGGIDWISHSTGTGFTTPLPRDPACGSAFGCLVVTSSGLPGRRTIDVEPFEPHYHNYPYSQPKHLGMIKAGEKLLVQGTVTSAIGSNGGLGPNTDVSDFLQFSVAPGVTVTGRSYSSSGTHVCAGSFYTYSANMDVTAFPWSGNAYVFPTFSMSGCQSLDSILTSAYGVELDASGGQIKILVEGPGGPYLVNGTRFARGLSQGTYTIRAGTDGDNDGVLCEVGDFCATASVAITDFSLKSVSLSPR